MRLENKVALISGGSRGQGAAEARLFAREGCRVVIADVLADEGRRLEPKSTNRRRMPFRQAGCHQRNELERGRPGRRGAVRQGWTFW